MWWVSLPRVSHLLRDLTNQFGVAGPKIRTETAGCRGLNPQKVMWLLGKTRGSRLPQGDQGTDTGTDMDSRLVFTEFTVFTLPRPSRSLMLKQDLKSLDKTFPYSKASPNPHGRWLCRAEQVDVQETLCQ